MSSEGWSSGRWRKGTRTASVFLTACPRTIHYGGATDRIHLVVDCVLNDWLKGQFDAALPSQ